MTRTRRQAVGVAVAVALVAVTAASSDARSGTRAIELVPAPPGLIRGCARAASRLHVTVYCPRRVPAGWAPRVCVGCNGTFSASGWFPAPRGYIGQPGEPTGHFTVWAAPPGRIREGYVGCTDGRRSGRAHAGGVAMKWITCPNGSTLDAGHVLLQWSAKRWVYALSLHSDTPTNRRLLRALARTVLAFG